MAYTADFIRDLIGWIEDVDRLGVDAGGNAESYASGLRSSLSDLIERESHEERQYAAGLRHGRQAAWNEMRNIVAMKQQEKP